MQARSEIPSGIDDPWRYQCPHCKRHQLRRRQCDSRMVGQYVEIDTDGVQTTKKGKVSDVKRFYCDHCKKPVGADERIDKKADSATAKRGVVREQ
jgi:hypothetical protein